MTELETVEEVEKTEADVVAEMEALDVLMAAKRPVVVDEYVIRKRDGIPADLKLKLGTVHNFDELSEQASTRFVPNREERRAGMTEKVEQDQQLFLRLVVVAGTKHPNLETPALLQAQGVPTGEALVEKLMRPGEIAKCAEYVMDLSGYSDDSVERAGN